MEFATKMKLIKKRRFVIVMFSTVLPLVLLMVIVAVVVHSDGANNGTRELKLLHVIIRHGTRTPETTYPKDPHANETFFPVGRGQLTNQGKLELYHLGKYLRKRYHNFLGEFFDPLEYYTQSTDVDRTKVSVEMVNAGLWMPKEAQKWGPLEWQPVPVHSEPLETDNLLLVRIPCPQYHIELDRLKQTQEIRKKFAENQELFQNLTSLTGQTIEDFDDVQDVYSTLTAEKAFNLALPQWTEEFFPDKMTEATIFSYILNAYNKKLQRLKGGVLLKKLTNDWKSKAENADDSWKRKAFLYGGHDSTIVNILRALGVWDPQIPTYGITIFFEYYKDTVSGQYGIEVYLMNTTETSPYLLSVPGCGSFCPLEKLTELTADVIPDDWQSECSTDDNSYSLPPTKAP